MAEEEKSITWVVAALALAVLALGWGFLAGSYSGAHAALMSEMSPEELENVEVPGPHRTRQRSRSAFIANAIEQLPNIGAVLSWHFSNRVWLPILIILAEFGVIGCGIAMKKLEAGFNRPRRSRHR